MAYLAATNVRRSAACLLTTHAKHGQASDYLHEAQARLPTEDSTLDVMGDVEDLLSASACPSGESAGARTVEALGVVAAVLGKAGRAHQHMMDVAHECLSQLTDGTICGEAAKAGARHSREEHLEAAHRHLVAAGATCDASGVTGSNAVTEEEQPATGFALGKDTRIGDLAKVLAGERAEKAALAKVLDEIVPMLDTLTRRVDDIARAPLPPPAPPCGAVSVSKQQDGGNASGRTQELSQEVIASALGKMSKENRH
jgi:hypothetical protein